MASSSGCTGIPREPYRVILEQVGSYNRIWKFLENAVADAEKSRPLRHFHLAELTDSVRKALEKVKTDLDAKRDAHPNLLESDPILDCLTVLFDGRVGKPFDADAHKKAIAKSKERFESRRPPAFLTAREARRRKANGSTGMHFCGFNCWTTQRKQSVQSFLSQTRQVKTGGIFRAERSKDQDLS